MNIIDKLKEFFRNIGRKNKPLLLEEPKVNRTSNLVSFKEKYKVKEVPNLKEPSFEECIDEFIKQYSIQEEVDPKRGGKAYHAFVRMFCDKEEDVGNNFKNQQKLVNLVRDRGCSFGYQYANGKASFMHILGSQGIDENKDLDVEKIYLNCDRKNIALLTGIIFNEIRDIAGDKLQMKCISEQILEEDKIREEQKRIKNYQRNEKIVIYAENHMKAERIVEKINEIRNKHPELFSSQKTLPFLPKKFGVAGLAKKSHTDFARTPVGVASGATYNDYISDLIYKCVISGFDKDLGVNSYEHQNNLEERMGTYAKIYKDMAEDQKAIIMRNIKETFEQVSRENNVNTVYRNQIQTERQNDDEHEFYGEF